MTEKLYRLKPWRWVPFDGRPGVFRLVDTDYYCFPDPERGTYTVKKIGAELTVWGFPSIEGAKRECERLALERLLWLIEEVPPSEPEGPIRP